MRLFLTCFAFFYWAVCSSHPSWGIVVNNQGEIYFTDVLRNDGTLWKVNSKGELTEILKGCYAYDLHLDENSNLWLAESLRKKGKNLNALIKISADSNIDTLIATRDKDFFNGSSLAVGPAMQVYFINDRSIYKYTNTGPELHIEHQFAQPKTLMVDTDGVMWITDSGVNNGTLYRFTKNSGLKVFASDIMPQNPTSALFKEKDMQYLLGIAKDGRGNIYVSENAGCRIIKINPKGKKSIFYESTLFWSPMNVAFFKGDAYIMEIGYKDGYKGPRIIKKNNTGAVSRLVKYRNCSLGAYSATRQ